MIDCEICGKPADLLKKALIEGASFRTCEICSKLGTVVSEVNVTSIALPELEKIESVELISLEFSRKIKRAREILGLKQKELAKKLNEREAVIHSLETGKYQPDLKLAKKLEKFLNISIVEQE